MTRLSCHSRAISPGKTGPRTVTHGSRDPQVRLYTGLNDANSQADSAGSIPVTRSTLKAQVSRPSSGHVVRDALVVPCPFARRCLFSARPRDSLDWLGQR
jgi:hypothetical protein